MNPIQRKGRRIEEEGVARRGRRGSRRRGRGRGRGMGFGGREKERMRDGGVGLK